MSFSNASRIALVTRPNRLLSAPVPGADSLPDAGAETVETELMTEAGAVSVHARLTALLDPALRQWTCTLLGRAAAPAAGDAMHIVHPRFGLAAGQTFLVLSADDRGADSIRLTLYGGKD